MEKVIATTLEKLLNKDGETEARKTVAKEMGDAVKNVGAKALVATIEKLKVGATDKKNAGTREGAGWGFDALATAFGKSGAAFLIPNIVVVTNLAGDATNVKAAGEAAASSIFATLDSNGIRFASPFLFEATNQKYKWQSRVLALNLVAQFARIAPGQTTRSIPELIPSLSAFMGDARAEVSKAAEDALLACCNVVDNKDIEPFIPTLVSCIARPEEVVECVYKLSSTTFVQAVGPPTLAIIAPVLERGLKERQLATKRKVSGRGRGCVCVLCRGTCCAHCVGCGAVAWPCHLVGFLPFFLPPLVHICLTHIPPSPSFPPSPSPSPLPLPSPPGGPDH